MIHFHFLQKELIRNEYLSYTISIDDNENGLFCV